MRREFPVIIRKDGETFIPKFPIDLVEGDQILVVEELRGSQVPEGHKWTITGYSESGPIATITKVP